MKKLAGILTCLFLLTACNPGSTDETLAPPAPESSLPVKPLPPVTPGESTVKPLPPVTASPSITLLDEDSAPTSSPPTPSPTASPTAKPKTVALTFDDGPSSYTPQILKILQEEDVPATFFVTGRQAKDDPQTLKLLTDAGMSVQSHSWRHADLTTLSSKELAADLNNTAQAVKAVTGKAPTCVRPPYGAQNKRVRAAISEGGARMELWNVDSLDWKTPGSSTVLKHTISTLQPESVILLHDGVVKREQTVEMLLPLIKHLKKEGYTFKYACKP